MSQPDDARRAVGQLLLGTREEELDCDDYLGHLAQYVEGSMDDERLRALMEHHREICPECEEERAILARALGLEKE